MQPRRRRRETLCRRRGGLRSLGCTGRETLNPKFLLAKSETAFARSGESQRPQRPTLPLDAPLRRARIRPELPSETRFGRPKKSLALECACQRLRFPCRRASPSKRFAQPQLQPHRQPRRRSRFFGRPCANRRLRPTARLRRGLRSNAQEIVAADGRPTCSGRLTARRETRRHRRRSDKEKASPPQRGEVPPNKTPSALCCSARHYRRNYSSASRPFSRNLCMNSCAGARL